MSQPPSLPILSQLFAEDSQRVDRFTWQLAGITFDWSKMHLTREWLEGLAASVDQAGYRPAVERLFAGEVVNPTEGRAAEHLAERGFGSPDSVALATARWRRM